MSDTLITPEATDALFEGIEITAEAKGDFAIQLEAMIISKVDTIKEGLIADNETVIAEATAALSESMEENINTYLDYVVETWAEDNAVAIESSIKSDLVEGFVTKMTAVFAESHIGIPDSQLDVVKESETRVAELEASLDKQILKVASLKEGNEYLLRLKVIEECSADLTDTQKEKLNTLAEGFDFDSLETFTKKVTTLKEAHFKDEEAEEKKELKEAKLLAESNDPMAKVLADLASR